MAVPRTKVTRSKRRMRRAHDSLPAQARNECEHCGELKRPHHICGACGKYAGRDVLPIVEDDEFEDDVA